MTLTLVAIILLACAFLLGRASTQWTWATPSNASDTTDSERIPMSAGRLFALLFLCGWMLAWSAGILMALAMFVTSWGNPAAAVFMGGWLIAAVAGWFAVANMIWRLATGKPVKSGWDKL